MGKPLVSGRVMEPEMFTLRLKRRTNNTSIPIIMTGQPTPPSRNKCLIAGLIKGNQWLISPDHKAGYFWGEYVRGGYVDQPWNHPYGFGVRKNRSVLGGLFYPKMIPPAEVLKKWDPEIRTFPKVENDIVFKKWVLSCWPNFEMSWSLRKLNSG